MKPNPIMAPRSGGPALGIFEDAQYRTDELAVKADDLILFFTDGLFEVENADAESFGEARLREAIRRRAGGPTNQLMDDVFTEIESFADGHVFPDDVCLVGMEIARVTAAHAPPALKR